MGNRPRTLINNEVISRKDIGKVFYELKKNMLRAWTITAKSIIYRNNWKGQPRHSYDLSSAKWIRLPKKDLVF